jgi:hypothetical protein
MIASLRGTDTTSEDLEDDFIRLGIFPCYLDRLKVTVQLLESVGGVRFGRGFEVRDHDEIEWCGWVLGGDLKPCSIVDRLFIQVRFTLRR